MFSNKTIYCLNSAAVGDLMAAAPVLKHAIETYHTENDYKVSMFSDFIDLFPFIPKENIIEISTDFDKSYSVRTLNMPSATGNICKLTPSRMKLTHYASIGLMGKVLSDVELEYVPLEATDVSGYGVDFKKSVIIVTTYRDKQRTILPAEIKKIAEYVYSKGLTPVYVGKTGAISIWKKNLAMSDFEYPGFGVDLRDKTSFRELFTIMNQARAVVGVDGGPMHLAFATKTPVVCGFTTIRPDLRIPYRGLTQTAAVTPAIVCNFCESDWNLNFWDFSKCPRKMEVADCVKKINSLKFINALEQLGVFK